MKNEDIKKHRETIASLIGVCNGEGLEKKLKLLGTDAKVVLNSAIPGMTFPLHIAATNCTEKIVKICLNYGADPSLKFGNQTALDNLFWLISWGDQNSMAKRLNSAMLLVQESKLHGIHNFNDFTAFLLQLEKIGPNIIPNHSTKRWLNIVKKMRFILDNLKENDGDIFAQHLNDLKRFGHTLGLDATMQMHKGNFEYIETSEGNRTVFSLYYLKTILTDYIATAKLDEVTRQRFITISNGLFNPTLTGPMLLIPTGWPGHVAYLVRIGNLLILCNRGERYSDRSGGVKIFKLTDANIDTVELMYNIAASAKDFEEKLSKIVDLDYPIKEFTEIKQQGHDTCTFVNAKSLIVPLLFALGDKNAHATYKGFTSNMRDNEVDALIDKYKSAEKAHNINDQEFYSQLLRKYVLKIMLSHSSDSRKNSTNANRVSKILNALSSYTPAKTFVHDVLRAMQSKNYLEHKQFLERFKVELAKPIITDFPVTPTTTFKPT